MSRKFDFLGVSGFGKRKQPRVDPRYATLNRRMIAAIIDLMIIMLLIAPLSDFLFNSIDHSHAPGLADFQARIKAAPSPQEANKIFIEEMRNRTQMVHWLMQTLILCMCIALCWRKWSATPGKILLRMRIADATTELPISKRQILLRLVGYFVSTIFLCGGFFWIGIDKRRQGWHDKIAHTVVLCLPRKVRAASDQAL